jgi:hypothetical protein
MPGKGRIYYQHISLQDPQNITQKDFPGRPRQGIAARSALDGTDES